MTLPTRTSIVIATYNVLADAYVMPEYFKHLDPKELPSAVRYPRVAERVAGLDADVICLQEVDIEMFRLVDARLRAAGYRGRWAHKDGSKPDGVATFVRLPWATAETRIISLSDQSAPDASGHVAMLSRLVLGAEDLTVVNTHLKWDQPDLAGTNHVAFVQAQVLTGALEPHGLVVVCGDLNAGPHSAILEHFHHADFVDAHRKNASTCSHDGRVSKIDYILVRGRRFGTTTVIAHEVPIISVAQPAPSDTEPSDHVPVTATIVF